MLLFRSEEHAAGWSEARGTPRGATMPAATQWRLARAWYAGRIDPGFRRRTPAEAESLFTELGLTGAFWRLTAPGDGSE